MAANVPILVGDSNFEEIAEKHAFFIDKSEIVKEFINGASVSVILRPRRFGKSTNLSLLSSFLSIRSKVKSFNTYKIGKDKTFCEEHFKKYPVIQISFKDIGGNTWEEMRIKIWGAFDEVVDDIKRLDGVDLGIDFSNALSENFSRILYRLIKALYLKHGKRVIVLIDEYDAPLNKAFAKGFYDEASAFFTELYSLAFKDNKYLKKGCLMGIMEVRGASIFSGLNNFCIYSIVDDEFSEYFGFSAEEINLYCHGTELENVLYWYNGYQIGKYKMINPWSFSFWLKRRKLESFWVGTSTVEALGRELAPDLDEVLEEVFQLSFTEKYEIVISGFTPRIRYDTKSLPKSSIWNLLIQTGYLSYEPSPTSNDDGIAVIPNKELLVYWQRSIVPLVSQKIVPTKKITEILTAFKTFDVSPFPGLFKDVIDSASIHNFKGEASYHMAVHGLFYGVCLASMEFYKVSSDREAGHGRYDLVIIMRKEKKVFIIEFKKSESQDKLNDDAEKGLAQIIERNYMAEFPGYSFLLMGVSFYKKHISELKCKIVPASC